MNITWTIAQLDRKTSNGFVTTAHWRADAVDGEYSASIYGTCGWTGGTPTTPYTNLTQETVLGWVWGNGVDKTTIENSLQTQINSKKTPTTSTGVPW